MYFSIPTLNDHGRHSGPTRLRALMLLLLLLAVMIAGVQGTKDVPQAGAGAAPIEALLLGGRSGGGGGPMGDLAGRQAATPTNLQTFTGALGGKAASPITNSGDSQRLFQVDSNTFTDFSSAASRSCADQHNSCAGLANGNKDIGFTVGQCDSQQNACNAAASTATQTTFQTLFSTDADFEYFCDL